MIRITMKGLAKYITAGESNKRKILRDFKFPDPEGSAQAIYYREARDIIEAYHRNNNKQDWLVRMADQLKILSVSSIGTSKTRYSNNARAIIQYAQYFSNKKYIVLQDFKDKLIIDNIQISVTPDLRVQEGNVIKLIKLEFAKEQLNREIPKIICQLMFETACKANLQLKGSQILFIDVPRGIIYKDARTRARMKTNIDAACKNIDAIWDGI